MKNFIGKMIAILIAAGCTGENIPTSIDSYPSNRPRCYASTESPFFCVAQACENAGGTYSSSNESCTCPSGQVFSAWDGGRCETQVDFSSCLRQWQGFQNAWARDEREFNRCLQIARSGQSALFVSLPPDLTGEAKAEWADLHGSALMSSVGQLPQLLQIYTLNLKIGAESLESLLDTRLASLTTVPKVSLPFTGQPDSLMQVMNVLPDDDLATALKPGAREGQIDYHAPEFHPALKRMERSLRAYFAQERSLTEVRFYSAEGCAGACELYSEAETADGKVTRLKVYGGGKWISDFLFFWETASKDRAYALVSLLPSGDISLIHFMQAVASPDRIPKSHYQIYDKRNRALLGANGKSESPVINFEKIHDSVKKALSPNEAKYSPQAVVCEAGFGAETLGRLENYEWLRGPYSLASDDPENRRSVFGWVNPEEPLSEGNFGRYSFSGVDAFNEMGRSLLNNSYSSHAYNVAKGVIGRDAKVKILPLGLAECTEAGPLWLKTVLENSRARVVNFSAVDHYAREACFWSPFAKQITENESSLLYVVAAGNDGLNGDNVPIGYCPQSLSGRPNLIVVAAMQGQTLSPISNFGTRYADIAVDAVHFGEGTQAYSTSYATPHVTHVAAKLQNEFPALSPELIRRAILVSAKIPLRKVAYTWNRHELAPLPVRSGGVLDESLAREVARSFATHPAKPLAQVLNDLTCSSRWSDADCDVIDARIQLLKQNGVL